MQVQLTKHKRARAHAAIAALRTRSVVPCFNAWRAFSRANRQRKQQLLSGICKKLLYNSLYRGLGSWKHFVEQSNQQLSDGKWSSSSTRR